MAPALGSTARPHLIFLVKPPPNTALDRGGRYLMALSPLINVPIQSQNSGIEVVRKGDGSQENDEVFVTTTLNLAQ